MTFYFANNGQQVGPFPVGELLSRGLRPDSLVWTDGMADWVRADSVPELRALFAPPPTAPMVQPAWQPQGPPQGAPGWQPQNAPATIPYNTPYPQGMNYGVKDVRSNKVAAGVCAILLGSLGVHKFILGFTGAGLIMLLVSVIGSFCYCAGPLVMSIIGIVEGIIYLTKTDDQFQQDYGVNRQAWF